MRRIFLTVLAGTISSVMYTPSVQAHDGVEHGGMHMVESMAAQHRMMATYATARAMIEDALRKDDAPTVKSETDRILVTITELKKLTPHKNLAERKAIAKISTSFERELKNTRASAAMGDLAGAREWFGMAVKRCAECHRKFRD